MRLTAAADHAHETVTHLIRVTGDRPGTVSRVARPKVTTTLSLLSEEQRVCRSRLSLEYRLLLHIDRLDSTLTALVRALDPLAPDLDRTAVALRESGPPVAARPGPGCRRELRRPRRPVRKGPGRLRPCPLWTGRRIGYTVLGVGRILAD